MRYKHILLDITQSLSNLKRPNTFIDNGLLKSMPQETHESSDSHILDKEEKVFQEVFMISALSGDGVNELRVSWLLYTSQIYCMSREIFQIDFLIHVNIVLVGF